MSSLLDKYLHDNPKQHTVEICNTFECRLKQFPTLWAVLSILLNTQDSNLEYVKFLQEEYNRYYADKSRKYMVNLETKSIEIQNRMHDSVTHDFDRVSDFNDNGLTPLQGQWDKQPEVVNRAESAIDNDVADIMTLYPSWSTDTNDIGNNNQVIVTEIEKRYKTKFTKTHQSKLKILSPIQITLMLITETEL